MRTWKYVVLTALVAALVVPATASAAFMHTVSPGESLSSIAAADGLSVDQLAAANGMSPDGQLVAGSTVAIPPQSAPATAPTAGVTSSASTTEASYSPASSYSSSSSSGGYLVQPGDTLSAIAARYGVSVDQLAAANGLDPNGVLPAGRTLSVSGAPASSASSEEAGESGEATTGTTQEVSTPVASSTTTSSSAGPQPTSEFVSPSEVGSIAAANGVPSSLAEAIGYQESGFNNSEVSKTGATGVMQIEPGTWGYIGRHLGGSTLSPSSATDNVRAGSLLLHSLLAQTGGNQAMAAAGYYQGLQSIRKHGIYPDTQQYVNDVMSLQRQFGGG